MRSATGSPRAGRCTRSRADGETPASAIVNPVNDSADTRIDTLAVADGLRPVLLRVGRELRREARKVGVSPEQVSLLVAVKYSPGIGIRELAARERISPPALSNHVDRLERDGLVERTPSDEDKRRVGLRLTDKGRRVLRQVRSRRTAWLASRLGRLDEGGLAAVAAAIEPLARLLEEDAAR